MIKHNACYRKPPLSDRGTVSARQENRIPEFWITAETVARSPDVAFSHSLKKTSHNISREAQCHAKTETAL